MHQSRHRPRWMKDFQNRVRVDKVCMEAWEVPVGEYEVVQGGELYNHVRVHHFRDYHKEMRLQVGDDSDEWKSAVNMVVGQKGDVDTVDGELVLVVVLDVGVEDTHSSPIHYFLSQLAHYANHYDDSYAVLKCPLPRTRHVVPSIYYQSP